MARLRVSRSPFPLAPCSRYFARRPGSREQSSPLPSAIRRERADTRPGDLQLQTLTPIGVHEVAYEAVLREIGGIAPMASMS